MKKLSIIIALLFVSVANIHAQTKSDAALAQIIGKDKVNRDANGKLLTLPAAEHLYRADVYLTNRHFPEAREHFQKFMENYPTDAGMAKALMGTGRALMWERQYAAAIPYFERTVRDFPETKEGRESQAFKGACLVRLNKNSEAAQAYQLYTTMYPFGERAESAYLNIIDALREAKKYDEANLWVDKARERFSGMATAINALQGRLRMEISRGKWQNAVEAADALRLLNDFEGSMTSLDEINYLKALALEKWGKKSEAASVYASIPRNSYFGDLAANKFGGNNVKPTVSVSNNSVKNYPIVYRAELLRYGKSKNIDPRFLLAIMKQESSFRANAKSPAAARGLLQLVYDTAMKYNKQAGFPNMQADDLYNPATNIAIGSQYIADLKTQFNGLYEAIAASYNGGEDNAARWLNRSNPKDAGVFASEVGFAETKNYVFKVMNNYRAYRELYTEDLVRR